MNEMITGYDHLNLLGFEKNHQITTTKDYWERYFGSHFDGILEIIQFSMGGNNFNCVVCDEKKTNTSDLKSHYFIHELKIIKYFLDYIFPKSHDELEHISKFNNGEVIV